MMVWHSSRISLTALPQTSVHLQRDVLSSKKSQRKATKLNKENQELPYKGSLKIDWSLPRRKLRGDMTQNIISAVAK